MNAPNLFLFITPREINQNFLKTPNYFILLLDFVSNITDYDHFYDLLYQLIIDFCLTFKKITENSKIQNV